MFPLLVHKVFDDNDRWLCCKYKIQAIRLTHENEQTRVMSQVFDDNDISFDVSGLNKNPHPRGKVGYTPRIRIPQPLVAVRITLICVTVTCFTFKGAFSFASA